MAPRESQMLMTTRDAKKRDLEMVFPLLTSDDLVVYADFLEMQSVVSFE